MIRCLPIDVKLYESHESFENFVTFVNVKSTYQIDEDVIVDYTLQKEFKSSTKDWIGIFPRNWVNLQQYLTFEYTLSPPPANAINSLNRIITFPRIFHREAPLNLEYQFVYISKEIQIMATSIHFRFISPHYRNESIQRCPYNSNNKEEKPAISGIPGQINVPQGLRPKCRYCHRNICGLKIDALRGDFLAAFSDSLVDRVHRLERDLNFADNALKNAKSARENLAKRLRAYEAFVAEMLGSLAVRGIVKITDEKGKELQIVLQRVISENDRLTQDGDAKKIYELVDENDALKSLLKKQQQTIVELTEQRNFNTRQKDQIINFIDREVQTNFETPLQSGILDLTMKPKMKETSASDDVETKLSDAAVATKLEENAQCEFNAAPPRVLKVPAPSGILVQGKNVKFAIVRL